MSPPSRLLVRTLTCRPEVTAVDTPFCTRLIGTRELVFGDGRSRAWDRAYGVAAGNCGWQGLLEIEIVRDPVGACLDGDAFLPESPHLRMAGFGLWSTGFVLYPSKELLAAALPALVLELCQARPDVLCPSLAGKDVRAAGKSLLKGFLLDQHRRLKSGEFLRHLPFL